MVTHKIKTVDGQLSISIPSKREEVTFAMAEALSPSLTGDTLTPMQQLSVLSGIPVESDTQTCLYDIISVDDLEVFKDTLQALAYSVKAMYEVTDIPKQVTLPYKQSHTKRMFSITKRSETITIPVISNLGIQPYGAYAEAKEVIAEEYKEWERVKKEHGDHIEFSPSISSLIRILALYFYCPATGEKFNPGKAAEFEEVVKKLPITVGMPIARYFFLRYPNLSKPKVTPSAASLKTLKYGQG